MQGVVKKIVTGHLVAAADDHLLFVVVKVVEDIHQFRLKMRVFPDLVEVVQEQEFILEQMVAGAKRVALELDGVE